jgi:hypothetical protein
VTFVKDALDGRKVIHRSQVVIYVIKVKAHARIRAIHLLCLLLVQRFL